jgi:hypothetical protein
LEGLQDDIFGILKRAALKTLIDERLNFGFSDVNGQRAASFIIMTVSGTAVHWACRPAGRRPEDALVGSFALLDIQARQRPVGSASESVIDPSY